jgi:hypothetical protein
MREVKVFKWEQQTVDGCRKSVKVLDTVGLFHLFGQDDNGEGVPAPVAVIELADGSVRSVYAEMIQFIPVPDDSNDVQMVAL